MNAPTSTFYNLTRSNSKKEKCKFEEQAVLTAGATFGERALQSRARKRAVLIAKEPTYLAYLEKQHFDLIISI